MAPPADPSRDAADASAGVQVHGRLDPGQVNAVTALCAAAAEADGVHPLSEHVLLHLRYGGEGPDRNLLLHDPAGELIGYAHLDPTDEVAGAAAEVVVHPAHRRRGHGRALVTAAERVAGERAAGERTAGERAAGERAAGEPRPRLRLWAHGMRPDARALAQSLGFRETRRLLQLRRSLLSPLPELSLPPGIHLRGFRPGHDEGPWLALNARAFADHPEQGNWTEADLRARMSESWFDPEGFLLAEEGTADGDAPGDGGTARPRLAGFHWTKVHGGDDQAHQHGHEPIGEVYVVGVDPDQAGRGIGRALTLAGLIRMRGQGLTQAMLYVEADNAAALAVYERLGFTRWDADVMFVRPDIVSRAVRAEST